MFCSYREKEQGRGMQPAVCKACSALSMQVEGWGNAHDRTLLRKMFSTKAGSEGLRGQGRLASPCRCEAPAPPRGVDAA